MAKIGEACHNENGGIVNGIPGDQTEKEVCINPYRPDFPMLFRAKDPAKAALLCSAMIQACRNDNIGYSQSPDRYTMYRKMLETGNISLISEPCATDCSQLVADCCIIVGIPVSPYMYTGDEEKRLMATDAFDKLTEFKEGDLRIGDILLRTGHHTAIVIEEDSREEKPSKTPKYVAEAKTLLNVRTGPGVTFKKYSAWPLLGEGNRVEVCDKEGGWCYIHIAGQHYAWASARYLRKI